MVSKGPGGLYVWRVDKPHAFLGLPFIGRHFGYVGMTNSFYWREQQQLYGSVKYGTTPYSWSDLRPKRYTLTLPNVILHGRYRRRITFFLETLLIGLLCPVYNDTQQAPYNLRKISKARAAAQRANRDQYGVGYRATKAVLRWVAQGIVLALIVYTWMEVR